MRGWKRAVLLLLVIIMVFVSGCYSATFKQLCFCTEYIPQKMPKQIAGWWRTNLSQYLHLSYINTGDQSAFGAIGGDVFSPNLYATYAAVGILDSISHPVEDPGSIIEWIQSLQDKNGVYYDKGTLAQPIEQTYWAISILKKLNSSPSNSQAILQFLKNHEQSNGLFMFSNSQADSNTESCISQTYFAISILRLLGIERDKASKIINLQTLSKTLQSYIASHISSSAPLLKDKESGYLISAIYELSYINKSLVSKEAYSWLSSKIREIDTLPYGVLYIALINNLFEAMESLGITPQDVSSVNAYLKQKVFPRQNANGGFSFGKDNSNFIEPMVTYEVTKLFKISSISHYPNLDKLIENLKIHRIRNGWIKFITFKPSVEATYYAVSLAKENGDIKDFPVNALIKYLTGVIENPGKSTTVNESSNKAVRIIGNKGVRVIEVSKVIEQLKTIYYAVKTYILLKKRLPIRLRHHLINTAKILAGDLSLLPLPTQDSESDLLENAEALSYFISIFNTIQRWPSDSFGLLNKIKDVSERLAYSVKHKKTFNIRMLYDFFILNSVLRFYRYPEADENSYIIRNALSILNTGQGFKRAPQLDITDVDSTYLGVSLVDGDIQQLDFDKIIKFVMESQVDYGFNYAPQNNNSVSDLKVTYEALWILNYLTTGWKLNYWIYG